MHWEEYIATGDGEIYTSGPEAFRYRMGIGVPGMEFGGCLVLETIWSHREM